MVVGFIPLTRPSPAPGSPRSLLRGVGRWEGPDLDGADLGDFFPGGGYVPPRGPGPAPALRRTPRWPVRGRWWPAGPRRPRTRGGGAARPGRPRPRRRAPARARPAPAGSARGRAPPPGSAGAAVRASTRP